MGMIIMNGKEYTSSSKDGFPPIVYSDEEREIGVWRDGKPLYQRTFVKTLNSTSSPDGIGTAISSSEIPNCVIRHIEASWYTLPNGSEYVRYKGWEGYANFWGVGSDDVYYNARWGTYASGEAVITIRYTKTTDTPGSGTWTTQGALAHHYSTDEKVIGTWIDGKPLYEKTFVLQSSQTIAKSAWVSVNIDLTDVKAIIDKRFINSSDGANTGGGSIVLKSNNQLLVGNEQGYDTIVFDTVILQYTKTTD